MAGANRIPCTVNESLDMLTLISRGSVSTLGLYDNPLVKKPERKSKQEESNF